MKMKSLQARLIIGIGLGLAVLWLVVAAVATQRIRGQMDRAADTTMAAAAHRLLPLLANDARRGGLGDRSRRLAQTRHDRERYDYIVRDARGRVLLRSYDAQDEDLPLRRRPGFFDHQGKRVYQDQTPGGRVFITIAEPYENRSQQARRLYMAMVWPLVFLIPLTLLVIWGVLRWTLGPVRELGDQIAARDSWGLSAVEVPDLPSELEPVADAVNDLMARLDTSFVAERAFAANAAHELRTPIAAAQAHIQRLEAEAHDDATRARAQAAHGALQRLTRLSQKLMQLARAEGGRLRGDEAHPVAPTLQLVVHDMGADVAEQIEVSEPNGPVSSRMDRDIYGILATNLIENALRYGDADTPVQVIVRPDELVVRNACAPLDAAAMSRISGRFERASQDDRGAGLGLSIVSAIAKGVGGELQLSSPIPGQDSGFEARVTRTG